MAEEWKEGVIIPIVKKGEGRKIEEYRGVTLMTALYKIYLMVLTERIKKDCEEKSYTTKSDRIQERDGNYRQHLRDKLSGK